MRIKKEKQKKTQKRLKLTTEARNGTEFDIQQKVIISNKDER